jgi:DNA invertase Pin-like site-specific DNA recombinase
LKIFYLEYKINFGTKNERGTVGRQGKPLTEGQIQRIVRLLETEEELSTIAAGMDISKSVVAKVNRKYQVRRYAGSRKHWTVNGEKKQH